MAESKCLCVLEQGNEPGMRAAAAAAAAAAVAFAAAVVCASVAGECSVGVAGGPRQV